MYNHRGESTGTNHQPTPQAEQFRRKAHPYQGHVSTQDTVGTYQGMDKDTNMHFFSADAKGGGATDSIMIPHHESSAFIGSKGSRYVFGIDRSSADIKPYDPKSHYGISGAPMSDTPADMADYKFQGK